MSRFFRAGSDSESSYYSSDDEVQQTTVEAQSSMVTALSRFGKDVTAADDSDDDKRVVVKSGKDKFKDEIIQLTDKIDDACDENDTQLLSALYDRLQKLVTKHLNTTIRDYGYPSAYTFAIFQLEKYLQKDQKDDKVYVALKAKVRKTAKQLEDQLGNLEDYDSEPEKPSQSSRRSSIKGDVNLYQKLSEVLDSRGKKGTDKAEQLAVLEQLLPEASDPVQKVKVLLALISARFDFNQGIAQYQSGEMWKQTEQEVNQLLDILEQTPSLSLSEVGDEWDEETPQENVTVRGSLVSVISRLDDEFQKHLQSIDGQDAYADRLKDELVVYQLILRADKYSSKCKEDLVFLRLLRLEKLYYKTLLQAVESLEPQKSEVEVSTMIWDLCKYLYKNAHDRTKLKVMLLQSYHHSLHLRYEQARDLLLMSRLQDSIHNADINTQVLYNRALTQFGICAFRCGQIKECASALGDVMQSLKSKDLLAQGTLSRYLLSDDKREKHRILPSHMHINLELLEAIQLTVSMLLKIPSMAANSVEIKKKSFSKPFRKMYEHYQSQVFTAPPENYKEAIMQATSAMAKGDWKQCRDLINEVAAWSQLAKSDELKSKLTQLIKAQSIRTFLLSSGSVYSSVSLKVLEEQFELDKPEVLKIIHQMVYTKELKATVDRTTAMLKIQHKFQMSRFQHMVMQYADKIALIVESTEKQAELKFEPKRLMEQLASKRK